MKLILSLFSFFILSSCGEPTFDNNYRGRPGIQSCDENKSACVEDLSVQWLIVISKIELPSNLKLTINTHTVFNECENKDYPFIISRGDVTSNIIAENFEDLGIKSLNIKLYRMDSNCLDSTLYYFNDNQVFQRFVREPKDLIRLEITN